MSKSLIVDRVAKMEGGLGAQHGFLTIIQACDESEDEAIARAHAEDFIGTLVIIKRFCMTVAECVAAESRDLMRESGAGPLAVDSCNLQRNTAGQVSTE